MAHPGMIFLMYHELEMAAEGYAGRNRDMSGTFCRWRRSKPDEVVAEAGVPGLNVSQALECPAGPGVCTDGCETDLIAAAPILVTEP